ncbi:hypothetical protein KI387_014927, partial [Taxus chinensis]
MRETRGSAGSGEIGRRRTNVFGTLGTKMREGRGPGEPAENGTESNLELGTVVTKSGESAENGTT